VRSFDPDVDEPPAEGDETPTTQLGDDLVEVDADRAIALLDAVTAELPGGGESREGQRAMVRAVAAAISRRRDVIIEAGTGVGKSLGYLVPLALSGRRVVVSTATKNLQDQLAGKDAPLVAAHVAGLSVAVLKGRSNYLCRLRLSEVGADGQLALDDGDEVPTGVATQMRRIIDWSRTTTAGDRDELAFEVDARAWRGLSVTPQECLGRSQCPQGHACFAELARDRAAASDVVVVNTHLYAAHLSAGATILPEHDVVVFDEAHEVLDIFAQMLGTSLSATRFRAAGALARGVLGGGGAELVGQLADFADRLARALDEQFDLGVTTGLGEAATALLDEGTRLVSSLVDALRERRSDAGADEHRRLRAQGPAVHLANDLARLRAVSTDELLWLTRREREVELELSLVDVGPRLRQELWGSLTAILTSATIPEGLARDLGLDALADELRVPSPFDYTGHALLYVPDDLPARTSDAAEAAIADELVELITAAGGRTLALFTNRAVMRRVADSVRERVPTEVLVQDTLSRQRLIERFRDEAAASLFAVTSYWQGVDVPGHSLALVTIDRLPFARPDDPLSQARRERAGERAFYEVDVPRAAMLLAQGVGRLIRTTSDRGVVAVLDTRLATAGYRSRLLRRLPPMRRTRSREEVVAFLRAIDADADSTVG
jgi:ATP-dependent DNA helicase DinG